MSEQEEYLDRLLNGLNEEPEDELEDFSFDEDIEDLEGIEDIEDLEHIGEDEEAFFNKEFPEFEDTDALGLESMDKEQDSGLDVSEFDFQEDSLQSDQEDVDLSYQEDREASDFSLDSFSELGEAKDFDLSSEILATSENSGEEPQETFDPPEQEEQQETFDPFGQEEQQEAFDPTELETFQMPEEQLGEPEMLEENEEGYPMEAMEEEGIGDVAEIGDISDEEALANILDAFSDDEAEEEEPLQEDILGEELLGMESLEEEQLAEEAVLDTPQDLGLELEEADEPAEDIEEAPQKKKKKEKKKKEKKAKIKKESQDKKPSLFKMLLEEEEEELTPEELEAEEAKKAEKAEKKEAKKAAAAEKKQQAKEAAAKKKAEKETEKRQKKEAEEPPEPWPVVTKKIMPLMFLFGATFVAVVIILSNVLSYSPYVSNARQYFDNRQYEKAYEQLMGIHIKEKDEKFYNQVLLMNQLQVKVTSSKNHLLNGEKELAVNDLIQAVLFYNNNLEKAGELGLENEFQIVYASLQADLSETFGISIEEAAELGAITDAAEYQRRIGEIVQ